MLTQATCLKDMKIPIVLYKYTLPVVTSKDWAEIQKKVKH